MLLSPPHIMLYDSPTISQLSSVISQVTGPAFLLAAEAQLLSVVVSRLDRIVDRSNQLAALSDDDPGAGRKVELPILRRRARLVHRAIFWGIASCIVTSLLVILGFAAAFLRLPHEYGAALLFAVAMGQFTAALVFFAQEVKLGYTEIDLGAIKKAPPLWRPRPPRED